MPDLTDLTECQICHAGVWNVDEHIAWHEANQLHAVDCLLAVTQRAQANSGAYLTPQPCTCGLNPVVRETTRG